MGKVGVGKGGWLRWGVDTAVVIQRVIAMMVSRCYRSRESTRRCKLVY